MSPRTWVFILTIGSLALLATTTTDSGDIVAMNSIKSLWQNAPSTWDGYDPCGSDWEGITCNGSRIIAITLPSMGLQGNLSGDIQGLTELQTLDLSYNKGLTGTLPEAIGKLSNLTNLVLLGCGFSGNIPNSIGLLTKLVFLSLNLNSFTGGIPASIGNLKQLYWLDLADNQLTGSIPVSSGTAPGLDLLLRANHFHFGNNKLSGSIPSQLFSSNMSLIHLLLDNNNLTGNIPATLGLVTTLEVVRLDRNFLSGTVPSNLNNLTSVGQLYLSNNMLAGPLPNLTGMNILTYVDMSNNSFSVSDFPSWFTMLPALTTLMLERTKIQNSVPVGLFSLPQLQTVILRANSLNGTLNFGSNPSPQLQLVDLTDDSISAVLPQGVNFQFQLILIGNPICQETTTSKYCTQQASTPSYSTPSNECINPFCSSGQIASPDCVCSYPYTGTLVFRAPSSSNLANVTFFNTLEKHLQAFFSAHSLPVNQVALNNATVDSSYLKMHLEMFPVGGTEFNRTGVASVGFALSNQTYKPPHNYGPYYFLANDYTTFAADALRPNSTSTKKGISTGAIIGIAVAGFVLVVLLVLIAVAFVLICVKGMNSNKLVEQTSRRASGSWNSFVSSGSIPQVTGARWFTLEELKKCTSNFSEANDIGSGGYGKVYKGVLLNGQLVAVKRSDPSSAQGGLEFKTEIELLSRVHHKNLVSLFGFCYEQGELMLVYEYVPNGTLKESLSGKSGVRLDWRRRVKVTLGAARGLHYLHELANPPIIHRDIKSNNVLLDETLTAKVSDFGLSKPIMDAGKGHITTQVKGTMGYLDPEYYMTQRLTDKSDVYSFGVLMLEVITGKPPIERGRYIVREVKKALDKSQDLYNLHELLDPAIGLANALGGFEKFMDLALRCVEETGSNRPAMGEVVKELENIVEAAGLNPVSDSASSTATFRDTGRAGSRNLYPDPAFNYSRSGSIPR